MFRREGSASSRQSRSDATLRKSDRRRLRDRTLAWFPLLLGKVHAKTETTTGDDDGDASAAATALRILDDALCVGGGGDLIGRKLRGAKGSMLYLRTPSPSSSGGGDDVARWPYRGTTQPVILELDRGRTSGGRGGGGRHGGMLVPCPALLSVMPAPLMLPRVVVRPEVSRYLCRGADLMRSGIVQILPLGVGGPHEDVGGADAGPGRRRRRRRQFGPPPRRGDVVAVLVRGNPQPFGVGFLAEDAASVPVGPGTKGVAVRMLYCYGDDLWRVQLPPSSVSGWPMASRPQPQAGAGGRNWDDGNYGNPGFVGGVAVEGLTLTSSKDEEDGDGGDGGDRNEALDGTDADGVDPAAVGVSAIDVLSGNEEPPGEGGGTPAPTGSGDALGGDGEDDVHDDDDDALLLRCFHTALNTTVTRGSLPMPVSTFFGGHLLPARPAGTTLDMKKTRHGKIGPFLREQADLGVISVSPSKDGRDKTAFVSAVHRSHPDLRANKKMLKEEGGDGDGDGGGAAAFMGRKKVVNLYRVPRQMATWMRLDDDAVSAAGAKSEARRGTGFLTAVECSAILSEYVDRGDLVDPTDPSRVVLDGPLCDALWSRPKKQVKGGGGGAAAPSSYPTRATRKELRNRWFARMEPAHALVVVATNQVISIQRGEPSTILIEVGRRGGRKKDTRVRGLEAYGIDGTEFANDVSKRFGCAASIDTKPKKRAALKKGNVEVVLQGNLVEELKALLTGDEKLSSHGGSRGGGYFVPKNVIKDKIGKGVAKKRR